MTADAALERVRAYWTAQLGFDPDRANGVLIARPEGTLTGYNGVYVFRHGYSCIVSPPAEYRALLRDALAGSTPDAAFNTSTLTAALGGAAGEVVGPAWIGVADEEDFRPPEGLPHVRPLQASDRPALLALRDAAGPHDWDVSAIEPERAPIFGVFERDALLAASSYEPWGEHARAVGVVTHPRHRHHGYGRAVATAATAHALKQGFVMLWQTLESNTPSMAIARTLGYQPYARTIAIRLRS